MKRKLYLPCYDAKPNKWFEMELKTKSWTRNVQSINWQLPLTYYFFFVNQTSLPAFDDSNLVFSSFRLRPLMDFFRKYTQQLRLSPHTSNHTRWETVSFIKQLPHIISGKRTTRLISLSFLAWSLNF